MKVLLFLILYPGGCISLSFVLYMVISCLYSGHVIVTIRVISVSRTLVLILISVMQSGRAD